MWIDVWQLDALVIVGWHGCWASKNTSPIINHFASTIAGRYARYQHRINYTNLAALRCWPAWRQKYGFRSSRSLPGSRCTGFSLWAKLSKLYILDIQYMHSIYLYIHSLPSTLALCIWHVPLKSFDWGSENQTTPQATRLARIKSSWLHLQLCRGNHPYRAWRVFSITCSASSLPLTHFNAIHCIFTVPLWQVPFRAFACVGRLLLRLHLDKCLKSVLLGRYVLCTSDATRDRQTQSQIDSDCNEIAIASYQTD